MTRLIRATYSVRRLWPASARAGGELIVASASGSLREHAVMGYLPRDEARVGRQLLLEYFDEGGDGHYPMTVRVVGAGSLYDPENQRVRG